MDHQAVVPLLSDHVRRRLAAAESAAIEAHIAGCAECRDAARVLRQVVDQTRTHGEALFDAHPEADDLARYALASVELGTGALARVGAHLRACATCRRETDLAREAAVPAWARTARAWLRVEIAGRPAMLLRPALAVLAVLLIYPTYLGLVKYPEERLSGERAASEIARLRASAPGPSPVGPAWGGGVQPLVLSGPSRGVASAMPTLRVRAGQPVIPVLADFTPRRREPASEYEVVVFHEPSSQVAWRHRAPLEELWDPTSQTLSLLLPTAGLTSGSYLLEVRGPDSGTPELAARFEILADWPR